MTPRDVSPAEESRRFSRFLSQAGLDARLWLFCMTALALVRVVLIAAFRARMEPGLGAGDFGAALWRGCAFDAQVAALWVFPSFLASLACAVTDARRFAQRLRRTVGAVFTIVTAVLAGATLGYFREYGDQFNHWIFGLVEDDRGAILATIWKEYHPLLTLAAAAAASVAGIMALRRALPSPDAPHRPSAAWGRVPWPAKALVSALIVAGLAASAHGSLRKRPSQQKDMAVTRDDVLNRTVYNPYTALRYAVKDRLRLARASGLAEYLPDGDIERAVRLVSGRTDLPPLANWDDAFARTAKGPRGPVPRHVFLFLLESYDAWPLLPDWAALGIAPCGRSLERRGLHWQAFLPDSDDTIGSLSALVTGLPDAGVATNYEPAARAAFPTAAAGIFHRLGYRTRLFYAGLLSWQRLGDFAREQGFDELYGAPHMGGSARNEWGVFDEQLFDFVVRTIGDDNPSFDVVITTANHPPFHVDVYGKGFALRALPAGMHPLGRVNPVTLGHFWYQDREVCRVLGQLEQKLPGAVFALTGDHVSRRFPRDRPTLFERSAVPLFLYGPAVLAGRAVPPGSAGSHVDILPTLVELAAPAGFRYVAVGHDLLDPAAPRIGLGKEHAIGPDFVADISGAGRVEPLPGLAPPRDLPEVAPLRRLDAAQRGAAWWRILKGPELPHIVRDRLPESQNAISR